VHGGFIVFLADQSNITVLSHFFVNVKHAAFTNVLKLHQSLFCNEDILSIACENCRIANKHCTDYVNADHHRHHHHHHHHHLFAHGLKL